MNAPKATRTASIDAASRAPAEGSAAAEPWRRLRRPTPLRIANCVWQARRLQIRYWEEYAGQTAGRGASIAVVGNAGYLQELQQGDFIDQHDLVLRMNNFRLDGYQRQIGRRIDVYMTNFYTDIDFSNPAIAAARDIVSSVPGNVLKSRGNGVINRHLEHIVAGMSALGRTTVFIPRWDRFLGLVRRLGRYPTTGAMSILLALELLELGGGTAYITGFSFFEGRCHYFSDARADTRNHDPQGEKQFVRELLAEPLRRGQVTMDPIMSRCLELRDAA